MSDQPTSATDGSDPQAAGSRPTALPIVINAQYVKDLSFENPNAPQSLLPGQPAPQVAVNVDVKTRQIAENMFEVVLSLHAEAKNDDRVAFVVELAYGGLFSVQGLPAEHQRPVLMIEGPRLLFPFARSIIAEATRDGGFPPLLINPIDFAEMFRRQIAAAQQAAQEKAN